MVARYTALLGKRVEVQYRTGDVFLPATATLVADSGRSIILEDHIHQNGRAKAFRWEIPYVSVMQIDVCAEAPLAADGPRAAENASASSPAGILGLRNNPNEA